MGQSSSTTSVPKGKAILDAKLETSSKTGILNLANQVRDLDIISHVNQLLQDLRATSSVWNKILSGPALSKLKSLDISGNTLKTIPVEVFNLNSLKTLHASRCGIQRTYDMSSLVKLGTLSLDRNDLECDNIDNLPISLQKINMSFNHLVGIPAVLHVLINLMELDLSANRIISLHGIGTLIGLVEFNVDDNSITQLPQEMANLKKLQRLSMKRNKLVARKDYQIIPAEFFVDCAIEVIDLTGNVDLKNSEIAKFEGIEVFLERRKQSKMKTLQGGGLTDLSLFGLD